MNINLHVQPTKVKVATQAHQFDPFTVDMNRKLTEKKRANGNQQSKTKDNTDECTNRGIACACEFAYEANAF